MATGFGSHAANPRETNVAMGNEIQTGMAQRLKATGGAKTPSCGTAALFQRCIRAARLPLLACSIPVHSRPWSDGRRGRNGAKVEKLAEPGGLARRGNRDARPERLPV